MSAELIGTLAVGATLLAAVVGLGAVMYSGLRQDIASLRAETRQDTAELRQDITSLRAETRQDTAELRQDIAGLRSEMRQDIGELRERMARVEGLFEGSRQPEASHG